MNIMKYTYRLFIALFFLITITSCQKEEKLDFKYNDEMNVEPTDLDKWIKTTFTDMYNMEVVYRFSRYKAPLDRNLMPPHEDKVRDQMEMVLKGYLLPYQVAGGIPFIKTYVPKEWILSGSFSVMPDGGKILASASGGRNITIFEVNNIDLNNEDRVRPKLKTIHHEFTHTLSQIERLPREFEVISEEHYTPSWKNTVLHPDKENDSLGFVSRYARSSVMEDFAETAGFLLAEGQLWYDNKAGKVPPHGYAVLKKKEAILVNYFRDNFGVDFRKLQREVSYVMHKEFNDHTKQSFNYWYFNQAMFGFNLPLLPGSYSPDFETVLNSFSTTLYNWNNSKYLLKGVNFNLTRTNATAGTMVVSVAHGTSSTLYADYNFSYAINTATNKITFTKTAQGTGTNYTYADRFMTGFMSSISNYLTSGAFEMDWSLHNASMTRKEEGFFDTGGFYKEGNRNNFLNFQLVKTKK